MKKMQLKIKYKENKSFLPTSIMVSHNLINYSRSWIKNFENVSSIVIVYDKQVSAQTHAYINILKQKSKKILSIEVKAGEELKSLAQYEVLATKCIEFGIDRKSLIVAIGGGTVGDAVGFLAGTLLRGIRWVGIPTTLLAQVDSAIGGKTAINHPLGKNLLGIFFSPHLVLCDLTFLNTLGPREMISGLGEIIKYALIYDFSFFQWIEKNLQKLMQSKDLQWQKAIVKSLTWKIKSVSIDPYDLHGKRESLNFGHTFGHALESITNYQTYQHGEAVIWGMKFAVILSQSKKKLTAKDAQRILSILNSINIPPLPKNLNWKEIMLLMKKDKKSEHGKYRFVLLTKIGKCITKQEVTEKELQLCWKKLQDHRKLAEAEGE